MFEIKGASAMHRWLNDPGGPRVVRYHVGLLAADRARCPDLDRSAEMALAAAEGQRPAVHLTQRRVDDGMVAYLATRALPGSEYR